MIPKGIMCPKTNLLREYKVCLNCEHCGGVLVNADMASVDCTVTDFEVTEVHHRLPKSYT